MLDWLAPKPECPVDPATRDWIDRRWAWLEEQFGRERLLKARVVLPLAEYFPDDYSDDPEDVRAMLDRVCGYMGIDPATVELSVYEDRNPVHEGQWKQGTAGLYHEEAGRFRVWVELSNLADPLGMVGTMAHELGHVLLLGQGRITAEVEDHEPLTDLLSVFLGLGVFTANSVLRENYWHAGVVSGWSMGRRGYLSMPMFGYALALFARARDEEKPEWERHLRPDVRAAFRAANRFLSNCDSPARLGNDTGPDPDETDSNRSEVAALSAEELLERYASGERDFRGVSLRGTSLVGADLRECRMSGSDLSNADLTGARFDDAELSGAGFSRTVLCGASLRDADLRGADFGGADLSRADLGGADIRGAEFAGSKLQGTILVGTWRDPTTNLPTEDLSGAICDPDMAAEDLNGLTPSTHLMVLFEPIRRLIIGAMMVGFVASLGMVVGGLAGWGVDLILGTRILSGIGLLVGAVGSATLAVRNILRHRIGRIEAKKEGEVDSRGHG
jgi:uncharacterized protein YjbI with pentapeptide repeats